MMPTAWTAPLHALDLTDAPNVSALRLVANGTDVELLLAIGDSQGDSTETLLSSVDLASPGPPRQRLALSQLLPVTPAWDVRTNPSGALEVVFDFAEGATYRLERQAEGAAPATVPVGKSLESFHRPRFIRGPNPLAEAVTTIVDQRRLVLLRPPGRPDEAVQVPVVDAVDGMLAWSGNGYSALVKAYAPGPVRGASIPRGTLRHLVLDPQGQPADVPQDLLPGTPVFEFDTAAAGELLVIFATVEAGVRLLVGSPGPEGLQLFVHLSDPDAGELESPAVLVVEGKIYLAALRDAGTPQAQVLVGKARLQPVAR